MNHWFRSALGGRYYVLQCYMLLLGLLPFSAFSANQDSLRRVMMRLPADTNTIKALNDYAMSIHETFPDSTRLFALRALSFADSLRDEKGKALSLNVIGVSYFIQNNYEKALDYYLQALALREKISDMRGVAGTLNNVGMVYRDRKEFGTALSYYFQALRLNDSLGNKQFYARNLNNIGVAYENMQVYDSALTYHRLSLELKRELGDRAGVASSLRNIGKVYALLKRYPEAFAMLQEGLEMREAGKQVRALMMLDRASVYEALDNFDAAITDAKAAMAIGMELGSALLLQNGHEILARIYVEKFEHKLALENYKRFITIRDSLFNETSTRRLAALQTNYEVERQRSQIELLTKERALQTTVRNGLVAGVVLSLLLLGVSGIAYRNKRQSEQQLRQTNNEILRQQHLLAQQAQEIEITNTALAENNIEISAANERLTALNNEKDEIMSIVSHDLKNPIAAISGFTDILREEGLSTEEKNTILDQVHLIGNRMLELVKNVLDSYQMESGAVEMRIVALDIVPVVFMSVEMYKERAAAKHISLYFEQKTDHTIALTDEQIFNQVLDNLLSNAVKYSPHGKKVFVRVKSSHSAGEERQSSLAIDDWFNDSTNVPITNLPMTADQFVRIEVEDEGPGISEDDMKKLFGKFARLSARPTGGEHSTGLGLSIVKKMVEAMNGRVWCESKLGKGARFIVELPNVSR